MKLSKLFLMSVAVVLFAAGACNKDDGGETATPEVTVGADVTVDAAGGTVTVDYSVADATDGVSPSVATSDSWLSAVAGDGVVTVTVDANDTGASRSATVTLSYTGAEDVSFTVTQTVPVVSVTSTEVTVSADGGSTNVSYSVANAVDNGTLSAAASETWVTAVVGDGVVTVTVEANTGAERNATVTLSYTYAQDVTVSVAQEEAFEASYSDYIGTWEVTDEYFSSATITISAATEGSTYTVSGWHFNGAVNTFGDFGFATNTDTSFDFTAYYNSSDKTLEFYTETIGETSFYNTYYSLTFVGDVKLLGVISSSQNQSGTSVVNTTSRYLIATFSLSSSTYGELTAGTVSLSGGGTQDILAMEYAFIITSPSEYSGSYFSYADYAYGNWFPSTAVKTSGTSSTSSVKSGEKVSASVKSEMKSVQVAL